MSVQSPPAVDLAGWPGQDVAGAPPRVDGPLDSPAGDLADGRPGRVGLHRLSTRQAHQVLAGWAAVWFLLMSRHGGVSWHFFAEGGHAVLDLGSPGGGLHVYAGHPELQMGPLAFLASALLLGVGPGQALIVAQVMLALAGLLVLAQACRLGEEVRGSDGLGAGWRLLLAGAAFIPVWMNLAVRYVHVDDALALVFVTLAVRAVLHRQGVFAGILIGMSVDAKPWALPFLGLLLALPAGTRLRPLAAAAGTVLAGWLPFLLADPSTILAAHFTIPNSVESTLRTLGISDPVTPWWDRPAQAMLGLALAAGTVRRGRWPAVVLLCTGARVVLDPGTYTYYVAGLVVGALLWDQLGARRTLPVWTWACAGSVFAGEWLPLQPQVHGYVRLVFFVLCVDFLVLRPPSARKATPIGPRHATDPGARRTSRPSPWLRRPRRSPAPVEPDHRQGSVPADPAGHPDEDAAERRPEAAQLH
jgi:hypothetical protein